jgi:hypothetical protein
MYYARLILETKDSVAERHADMHSARCWIEDEWRERAERISLGQIYENTPEWKLVATRDVEGWHPS